MREERDNWVGNSDKRGYEGGAEGEIDFMLVAFFNSDIIPSNFLLLSYNKLSYNFFFFEAF